MVQKKAVWSVRDLTESPAYRGGWQDGRFGLSGMFTNNPNLAGLSDFDRLAYYRGHREGQRIRDMLRREKKVLSKR